MKKHLAIFSPEAVKQIFSGSKTIETRFSLKRIAPFGEVNVGDLVYIKPIGKEIAGQFLVKKVISVEGLGEEDLKIIWDSYGKEISFGDDKLDQLYFENKIKSNYGTIIFLTKVEQFLTSPIKIEKKDHRGWVVLE